MRRQKEVLCYYRILATSHKLWSWNRKLVSCFHSAPHKSALGLFYLKLKNIYTSNSFFFSLVFFRVSKRQTSVFNTNVQTSTIKSGSCFEVVRIILVAFNFEGRKWSSTDADKSNKFHICILFIFYGKDFISMSSFYLLKGKQHLENCSLYFMAA